MNHGEDEDVDDFLYGDSGADKKEGPDSIDNQQESDKGKKPDEEEEDELYGLYQGGDDNEKEDFIVNDAQDQRDDDGNEDDQSDTNDLDDSDDDVEIILDADESEQPAEGGQSNANQDAAGKNSLVNIKPNATGKVVVSTQQKQDGTASAAKPAAGGIDLDAVGQLDGKPITDVELESFEDKPWRKPGADITDYFNYGFNEATWRAYCNKQKILREGKGKMMGNMDMPPEMAAMGMMMPPMMDPAMGGMPPNAMMGLPMGMPMNMPPGGGNPNFRPGRPNGPPSNQGQGQGRNNNRGAMQMGRIRGNQDGGGDDKSNASENGDDFNPEEQHMNFPMNFPGASPMGMFPPDMGPGGPMGGMPPFFNPNMAGPGGQMGFDGPGRGNPMMMMRGGGPMRPSRGRGSPAPGDRGSPNNDPRKRVISPEDDPYNKRPRNR